MHPPPWYLQFFPTLRCNKDCGFCFNRGLATTGDISVRDFERLTDTLKKVGTEEIDILGGEPTLHPQLPSLLEACRRKNLKTTMSSNGSDVARLSLLSEQCDRDLLTVGISVHGEAVPDDLDWYIRTYKPLLKGVCMRTRLIPEAVKRYLEEPGLRYCLIFMDTLYPEDLDECLPFSTYLSHLHDLRLTYENIEGVFCSGFVPGREHHPVLGEVRCPAGTTKLSVMPDGDAYPCYLFSRSPEFRLGNILTDDFGSIWENPLLEPFRHFDGNRCTNRACQIFVGCHGGCPALSYLMYHDLQAPDPRCVPPQCLPL